MNRQATKLHGILNKKVTKHVAPPPPPKEKKTKSSVKARKSVATTKFSGSRDYRLAKKYTCHKLLELLNTKTKEIREKTGFVAKGLIPACDFIAWLEMLEAEPQDPKTARSKVSPEASLTSVSRKKVTDPHSVFERFKKAGPPPVFGALAGQIKVAAEFDAPMELVDSP